MWVAGPARRAPPGGRPQALRLGFDLKRGMRVGLYGGSGVNRYSPQGKLLNKLSLPVASCTKPLFGGEDLRTLYVTSAWKGLDAEQRARQPLAGGLFAVRVDTPGLPTHEVEYDG